jgi:hypothetical protein
MNTGGKRSISQGVKRLGLEADEGSTNILCRSQVEGGAKSVKLGIKTDYEQTNTQTNKQTHVTFCMKGRLYARIYKHGDEGNFEIMCDKFTVYIICTEVRGSSHMQSNTTVTVLIYSVFITAIGQWAFASNLFLSSLDCTLFGRVKMMGSVMQEVMHEAVFL